MGDKMMRNINRYYRNVDKTTDVISFPQMEGQGFRRFRGKPLILGDVVINIDRIMRQARENGVSLKVELRYMLLHSILHLIGYDHERCPRDAIRMKRKEKRLLNALKKMDR